MCDDNYNSKIYLNNMEVGVDQTRIGVIHNSGNLSSYDEVNWLVNDYLNHVVGNIGKISNNSTSDLKSPSLITHDKHCFTPPPWDADAVLQVLGQNSGSDNTNTDDRIKLIDNQEKSAPEIYDNDLIKRHETVNYSMIIDDENTNNNYFQLPSNMPVALTDQIYTIQTSQKLPDLYSGINQNLCQGQQIVDFSSSMNQIGQLISAAPYLVPNVCFPISHFVFIPCFYFLMPINGIMTPQASILNNTILKPEDSNGNTETTENKSIKASDENLTDQTTTKFITNEMQPIVLIEKIDSKSLLDNAHSISSYVSKKKNKSSLAKTLSSRKPISNNICKKSYICKYCSHAVKTLSQLTIHTRMHTGEKPFKCYECSFATAYSSSLSNHIRRHTGEKRFECRDCQSRFVTSSSLKNHRRNKNSCFSEKTRNR
ncbi:transcriptional repressor CTCFL-like isoform X2 [Microplitis mediator]|uniref:transcriptional repressor CTCFL-like isoform X2 n=1 Tax=Microplitis mediator TaxID=375433 RepID=UPI00255388F4|nr:transcriptional repressor CTCFL-like isoform X2 [Microplitis mediator]